MIDAVMRKYRKKEAQPVQEFRTEMYAKQRDGETCSDVWQRKKRNAQGLRSAWRTVEKIDLADALKGSLKSEHAHLMITVDTWTISLDELEDKVFTMGQHVDQMLLRGSQSSSFVFGVPDRDINVKLDKVNKQLAKLSAALLSSTSGSSNESESRGGERSSDGRGGGRGRGGRGKRKK